MCIFLWVFIFYHVNKGTCSYHIADSKGNIWDAYTDVLPVYWFATYMCGLVVAIVCPCVLSLKMPQCIHVSNVLDSWGIYIWYLMVRNRKMSGTILFRTVGANVSSHPRFGIKVSSLTRVAQAFPRVFKWFQYSLIHCRGIFKPAFTKCCRILCGKNIGKDFRIFDPSPFGERVSQST